jgi:hypothetical protein
MRGNLADPAALRRRWQPLTQGGTPPALASGGFRLLSPNPKSSAGENDRRDDDADIRESSGAR